MRLAAAVLFAAAGGLLAGCAGPRAGATDAGAKPPNPTSSLPPVDLTRYAGRWYELGRYEAFFQRGCEASTAVYTPLPDGRIKVVNSCRKGGLDGPLDSVEGVASVVPGSNGAKLKVSFFGPFTGDYWVLDHARDYSWSIVGDGSLRYLWILSRDPRPGEARYRALVARATALGYDPAQIRRTQQ